MTKLILAVLSLAVLAFVATCSGSGNTAANATCPAPGFSLGTPSIYWETYADYNKGLLSVDFPLSNAGGGEALSVELADVGISSGVLLATSIPQSISNSLGAGSQVTFTVKYLVPPGVTSFTTFLRLTAKDACGNPYSFPGIPGPGDSPQHAGCQVFREDNIWNTPIDSMPVDESSGLYIEAIGAGDNLHPDFGSGSWDGGPIGIPFLEVDGSQPGVNVAFDYDDESDPGPYPVPPDAPVEGGGDSDGDRHVLVIDRDSCTLYELYYAWPQPDGSWEAGSGAVYDLNSNVLRPEGWTSADAAGLPVYAGLVRFDEVASGEITHALRFSAPHTRDEYVWPARHFASELTGAQYPPMGQRFRLKADYDTSGYSPDVQVILEALKKYGMMLADNGSPWFVSGAPDERWDNDVLSELKQLRGSDFEAVDVSSLMVDPGTGQANSW
jgi:hypothetical protein